MVYNNYMDKIKTCKDPDEIDPFKLNPNIFDNSWASFKEEQEKLRATAFISPVEKDYHGDTIYIHNQAQLQAHIAPTTVGENAKFVNALSTEPGHGLQTKQIVDFIAQTSKIRAAMYQERALMKPPKTVENNM